MSVTFSGGVTISGGGWTLEAAPPSIPTATAGWFGGGFTIPGFAYLTSVDRITYATDTATASVRGPIYNSNSAIGGAGDDTYGWFGGGDDGGNYLTTVYRITYSTDTAAATSRGALFTGSGSVTASSGIQ